MSTADGVPNAPLISLLSPCIGICKIDEATKLCLGCARTEAEIAAWKETADPERQRVWDALPARRRIIGIELFKLLWFPSDFLSFIEGTLRQQAGEWTIGIQGANISFTIGALKEAEITRDEASLTIRSEQIAWRFITHQKAAAFALGDGGAEIGAQALGIALPRSRINIDTASHFRKLGVDENAVLSPGDLGQLYDLGLGDRAMRVCLRATAPGDIEICDGLNGFSPDVALTRLPPENGLQYVIETGLGRCELLASNPSDDGLSAKLTLDSELLKTGCEPPPDWDLHPAFAPCAVFRPIPGHSVSSLPDALTQGE